MKIHVSKIIRKIILRTIALLLVTMLVFEDSGYVFATELSTAAKAYKEEKKTKEKEKAEKKEQEELYETYFGEKPSVTLSGNEDLFHQEKDISSSENEPGRSDEVNGSKDTKAGRAPILEADDTKEKLVDVGEFDKTYLLENGTYKTVFTSYPNTYDENGVEKIIDNTLIKENAATPKSVSENTLEDAQIYTNAAGYFDAVVQGHEEEMQLQVSRDDTAVQMETFGGDFSRESVSQNAIRYNDVYSNVDIQYTVTNAGMKENIILLNRDSRDTFVYNLKKDGIYAQKNGDSIFVYKEDADINTVSNNSVSNNTVDDSSISDNTLPVFAAISAPKLEDTVGAVSRDIEMELTETEDSYIITLKPDTVWLSDDARVYPVTVDSTITLQQEITDYTITSAGDFLVNESRHYTGNLGAHGTARYYLITDFLYQRIKDRANGKNVEITDATLRIFQTNESTGSTIGCYRNEKKIPTSNPSFDAVAAIGRKIAGENATSPSGYGEHDFDVADAVSGWMNGIYPSHGFTLILDNENSAAVEIAGIGAADISERPVLTINWQVAGDVAVNYPLDDTTINLRPMVKSDVTGALQCYGVFADGIANPRAIVSYDLSDPDKKYGQNILITNEKKYPDSSAFDSAFPEGTIRYLKHVSNWQTIIPFTDFSYDTLYHMYAKATYNGKTGKTVNSDNFLIYKVTRYDTMKKIADHYGVSLDQLLFDNRAADMLLVENNTLFIKNPTKNQNNPYQPSELTDAEKAQIDRSLLGRARHCEYGFEPINLSTGNYYLSQEDLSYSDSFGTFTVVRSYNSLNASRIGSFGRGFTSFLDENIAKNEQGDILYNREDGSTIQFYRQDDGSYLAPEGCDLKLRLQKTGEKVVTLSSGDVLIPVYCYRIEREDGSVVTFDETGVMVERADKNGAVLQIMHDAVSGNVTGFMREGAGFMVETNERGCVTRIICPDGSSVAYGYDSADNLVTVKNQSGHEKQFVYDENHLMTFWYREDHTAVVRNTYDSMGRVIKQLDEGGVAHTLSYTPGKTVTTDGNGNRTEYSYDSQGRTVQILYADGSRETKTYENGYLASETDTCGNTTTYGYDGNGRIIEKKTGDRIWIYSYDDRGNLIKTVDPLGNVSTGVFNNKDLVTQTTDGDGRKETYTYDDRGRLLSYTDSDGLKTSYTYQNNQLYEKRIGESLMAVYTYNAMGDVIEESDACGNATRYIYDSMHRCIRKQDKNGISTDYTYDENGLLKTVVDGGGHTLSYTYNAYGNIEKIIQPDGAVISYTYDAEKNMLSQTDGRGNTKSFVYDNQNRVIESTDESGYTVYYEYDKNGNITKKSDKEGVIFEALYDTVWGLPVWETDALGHKTEYQYDALGNLLQVIYEGKVQYTYAYDALMRRVGETYANGLSLTYTFDARNNLVKKEDNYGLTQETVYNDFCQPSKEISENGNVTAYTYDPAGNLLKMTDPEGNETDYVCDRAGNVTKITDPNGNSTEYIYDFCGNISTLKKADGTTLQYAYDKNENLSAYKDGNDNITTYAYDRNGNRTLVTDAMGQKTSYTYDERNNLIQTTDALNQTTDITYDYAGNIKKVTDENGADITFTYDRNQNLLSETDENGHTKSYLYDVYGRIAKEKDAKGNETTYTYDETGNLTGETDALSNQTLYTYDPYGNVVRKTDALSGKTSYTYGKEGELLQVTDADKNSISYTYDKNGNLVKETDALGSIRTYTYDGAGNRVKERDALGNETEYIYDSVNRLTETVQPDGTSIKLAYDNEDHVTGLWDGKGGKTAYQYDALGRIIKTTDPEGGSTSTAYDALSRVVAEKKDDSLYQYAYDGAGNRISETDPMGAVTTYTYDKAGNLLKKVTADQSTWSYIYDPNGQLVSYTDGDGKQTSYTYDALKRLTEVKEAGITKLTYTYDALSRVTAATDANGQKTRYEYDAVGNRTAIVNANGVRTAFHYDKNGQLTQKTYANGYKESYAYDAQGNLIQQTDSTGLETAYDYDSLGRLIKETRAADGKQRSHSYAYDKNGNVAAQTDALDHTTTYTYDANDRLTEVLSPLKHKTTYTYTALDNVNTITDAAGSIYQYTYDKKGRLLTEAVDTQILKSYTYDPMDRIASVESDESRITYQYGATKLLESDRNGEKEQYTYNAAGELIRKTDSLQNEISYDYDPAGNLTKKTDENGTETTYRYDALNELIDSDTKETLSSASYSYDEMGNVTSMKDVTGESTYTYDEAGRLIRAVDGSDKSVSYSYDGFGNLSTLTYPDGSVVRYTYDANGQLSDIRSKDGQVTYEYDAEGNVLKITRKNANGEAGTTILSYDDLNRVKNLVNTCNGTVISAYGYAYDNRSNITKETVLLYADGKETRKESSYQYDVLGELTKSCTKENGKETVVAYTYDPNGNRVRMETTSGDEKQTVIYGYDHDRLVHEEEITDGITTCITDRSYDRAGNLVEETICRKDGNGEETVQTTEAEDNITRRYYSYDAKGRLSAIADKDRLLFAALYDGGDNRVFTLEYDKKTSEPEQTAAIQTDKHAASGKRPQKTDVNDGDETDTNNQVRQEADTGETAADNASGTGDNANNNKKGSKRDAFLYGVLMEAASFLPIATPVKQWIQEHVDFYVTCAIVKESIDNRDEQKTAYLYTDLKTVDYEKGYTAFDAVNDVISRQTGTGLDEADYQKISYVNDINRSNEEVLYETVAGGNRANGSFAYRYGIQRESYSYEAAAITAGSRAFDSLSISQSGSYYYDGYGSVSNLSAGEDSISYTYDAYGNMQKTGTYGEISTDSSAYGSPYGYNGEYSHALTGLQYLRARYYQASTGSFISKDSYAGNIRNILSANRYTYGENNPLGYADPSGHSVLSKIKSAVSKVKTAVTNAWNTVKSAAQTIITANRITITPRKSGESVSQWKARQAQEKAKKSSAKADLASVPLNLYEGTKGWLSRKLQNCVEQIDSSIFGSAVYAAADFVCQAQKAACKGFAYCFNYAQEKIPDKDLSRILTGVGMIVGGAGKVTGAVALAALSAPLCAAGIGVAGEIAAGIVAASGGGDIAQGIQEIMYGWNGDSESESFNLVRDTLYCGNEEAYQISTGIAAASADLGKLLEVGLTKIAAKKAAKSAAKEAAEAVAKDAAEAAAKEVVESAAKGAGGLIDEAVEATAKEAAESAIKESVKQGTKDAIEDVAENSVDDLLNSTEDFYDDIFDPYYKEQFNPIGEEAIGNPNGIEGISKSGTSSGRTFKSQYEIPTNEKGYTKSSLELGKKVHKEYMSDVADDVNKIKEYVLPSGKRVDFIDFENKIVYELKPNNPNQIKKGTKQLAGYLEEIETVFGKGWSSVLDTY